MKLLHLINLHGFGGAERLFIEYLKNSSFENCVICSSNKINKNILPELSEFKIIYANRIFNFLDIRYPTFIRKIFFNKKIKKMNADLIIVWDFIPKFFKKPTGNIVYYDHGCSWRYPINKKTLEFYSMVDCGIAASHASYRIMELRFNPTFPIHKVINRLPIKIKENTQKSLKKHVILGTASK
ncbi:hypothetical protein [Xenorhabdus sp. TH1]|uniref:hypothetical protein n=1 Tax=Xenorhabdus sp. TH1 TaxID=3130166 RepID=UPI0030CF32B4